MLKRLSCLLVLLLIPALAGATPRPVKIGGILLLTGDYARQGNAFREGMELARDEMNSKGGVSGRAIELLFDDSQYKPEKVRTISKKMLEVDHVAAAVVSTFHEVKGSASEFERSKTPVIVLWDSGEELENMGDYIFGIGPWAASTGETAGKFVLQRLQGKRAVIINSQNEWSLSVSGTFEKTLTAAGGSIVATFTLNPGETDFRTLLARVKLLDADVLYAPVTDNLLTFFRQLKQVGYAKPVITSDNLNDDLLKASEGVFEGVYHTMTADPQGPSIQQLVRTYQKKFHREPGLPLFLGWGYDSVQLIAKAAQGGKPTGERIKENLYKIQNFDGASGTISINAKGSSPMYVDMFRVVDGRLQVMK